MKGVRQWAAAVASAWVGAAMAAQLGDLSVTSAVGAPFEAQVAITDVADNGKNVSVRLAPTTTYIARGIMQDPQTLNFSLSLVSRNPFTLRITSENKVTAKTFPLILELSQGPAVVPRLYKVTLLDKAAKPMVPVSNPAPTDTPPVASAAAAAPTQTAEPIAPSTSQQAASAAPTPEPALAAPSPADASNTAKSVEPASESKPAAPLPQPSDIAQVDAQKSPVKAEKASSTATSATAKKAPAAKESGKPKKAAAATEKGKSQSADQKRARTAQSRGIQETVETHVGMTLWSTVTPYRERFAGASTEQLIIAFLRRNPQCFAQGAVAQMRYGCTLVVPSPQQVQAVSKQEAQYFVQEAPQADARKRR